MEILFALMPRKDDEDQCRRANVDMDMRAAK